MRQEHLREHLFPLNGQVGKTYQHCQFDIRVTDDFIIVTPHSTGKSRPINVEDEIAPAHDYLHEGKVIEGIGGKTTNSIRELGFSEASSAYVWAILSMFEDVESVGNKLRLKRITDAVGRGK